MADYPVQNIKVPRFNEANGFYTTAKRSEMMSKIRSKETKPEVAFRKMLWHNGIRYRKNVKKLPGSPDIVLGRHKLIVFIDGEFWHGFHWEQKKDKIKSNRAFWIPKIERNMQRDRQNNKKLKEMGYTVLRFWANDIKKHPEICLQQVLGFVGTA